MNNYFEYTLFCLTVMLKDEGKIENEFLDKEFDRCVALVKGFIGSEYDNSHKPFIECLTEYVDERC